MTCAPTVRLAVDGDGETVRQLVEKQHGMEGTLSWDRIAPYWLVAELDGQIVGALQTCPSRPVGRLEMLTVKRGTSHIAKVATVKALAYAGMAVVLAHGAQQVQMFVAEDLEEFREIMMDRGAVVLDTGFMLAKRLI